MTTDAAAQPTDINELFHRDPLKLDDEDISKIVEEYRRKRAMFQAAPATAGKPKAKAAPKSAAAKAAAGLNLDLKL